MKKFSTHDRVLIFFIFMTVVFTGKENVATMFKWLEIESSPGAVFFIFYLYILLLFVIPFKMSLKTAAIFFGLSALSASFKLNTLAETLGVFSFSLIIINMVRLLHTIRSKTQTYD